MGRVIMSGIVPLLSKPVKGTEVGTLAVGSSVYLMENNVRTEFLVVNQGNPDASLYDSSCDGCWLLRKDIKSKSVWNPNNVNTYPDPNTTIRLYLEGDYFNSLGATEQNVVKQIKIPYSAGGGVATVFSGAEGYSTKVFLLGGYEAGFTTRDNNYLPVDGNKLSYFEFHSSESANNKRIANYNGSAIPWWLRSSHTSSSQVVWLVESDGGLSQGVTSLISGVRPALILPSTALIDDTGLLIG